MSDQTSKHPSNMQRAIAELRTWIFAGKLAPGSDHLESELAQRLGMSRTPVREAALVLESQGLLELRPRKGVRILPISADDMREIYDVLTELESLAAENAAEQGYTRVDLGVLARAIEQMEQALLRDDRETWGIADDVFHSELVRLGGNTRVEKFVHLMSDQVKRARSVTLFMRPLPTQSNTDHRGVYEAIAAGDPQAARQIHSAHLRQARDMIVSLLEKHRLQLL